jgi:hypothetical protein
LSQAYTGETGTSPVVVLTTPRDGQFRLEGICFTVLCDGTAGIHKARVTITDPAAKKATYILRDLNEGGANETLIYTYGIGLNASACVTVTGWEVTDALPNTTLYPGTTVTIGMVNDGGTNIAGDTILPVTLYGEFFPDESTPGQTVPLLPGLLPGSLAA